MPSPIDQETQTMSPVPQLPRPPSPSADADVASSLSEYHTDLSLSPESINIDVFILSPVAALKLLCGSIDSLLKIDADQPSIPSAKLQDSPHLGDSHLRKENLANQTQDGNRLKSMDDDDDDDEAVDELYMAVNTPIGSPEPNAIEPLINTESETGSRHVQQDAVARKFYSRKVPPIGLEEYLLRLHKYCPMSTAVYLSTSLYIYRLAIIDKIIPVTARNVHRLVLAGLRVTMKALEDRSYPHRRFAKVGGVTEMELGRLEISFCFITNFEFRVSRELLSKHAEAIRDDTLLNHAHDRTQRELLSTKDEQTNFIDQARHSGLIVPKAPKAA